MVPQKFQLLTELFLYVIVAMVLLMSGEFLNIKNFMKEGEGYEMRTLR